MADEAAEAMPGEPDVALPAGTVTFLFTDIAGSTELLRAHGEAYAAALDDHRRLLREAIAAGGGRVVDTAGDSFFAAFPTAEGAVAAAAAGQRALAGHRWPHGARVAVRMGLHTGEATVVAGGYVGLAVHRAARIAAAASGGQVLLSDPTAALLGDRAPAGTTLHPLGRHRLKDFPEPAALHQLDVAGLPTSFPPLRAAPRHPPLPVPAGNLLGREDDVAAVAALLSRGDTRLVTLVGPGGIGKTRLALEAARTVAPDLPGGAVFVPLGAVTDPSLVLPAIAAAVGGRPEPGVALPDVVGEALAGARTLVVLDNVEQVGSAAGDLAALLEAVPALVLLVTSRTVLRLRSERQYPVAPLAATPAARLFAERAAAVRPGFAPDGDDAAAVAEICRRLDGLPLAIELAAARVALLRPVDLLARLGDRLDVLGEGPVDLPERQRTLRATTDWSLGLLDPFDRTVFVRLAVFSGGWTVEAAELVCSLPGEPDLLGALGALVDASLITRSEGPATGPRLDMLQTVRAHAVERLAVAPERTAVEQRHTGWVLGMTEPVVHAGGRQLREALARLDRERANLRAAVQRSIDAGDVPTAALLLRNTFPYLARRDAQAEARTWLDQALSRAAGVTAATRGRLTVLRAAVASVFGETTGLRELLDEGRRLLPDDAAHDYDFALAAMVGALAAVADGALDEAAHDIDEAVTRSAVMGHAMGLAFMGMFQGHLAQLRGELPAAQECYRAALDVASGNGDEALAAQILGSLGRVQLATGDLRGGRRSVLDAAAANRRSGQASGMRFSLDGLAVVALAVGRPAVAAQALAAAGTAHGPVPTPLGPPPNPPAAELEARARAELGEQRFDGASAEGRQWSLEHALDRVLLALGDTGAPGR